MFTMIILVFSLKFIYIYQVSPQLVGVSVSYMPYHNVWPACVCILLFYKNYNVYNVVYMLISSGIYHFTKFRSSTPSGF